MTPPPVLSQMQVLTLVCGYILCVLMGGLGLLILWKIYQGDIDLSRLVSEPTGDASMSRFQFLVFTFVISLSLFLVIVASPNSPTLPTIPPTVLTLLGISGSSYLVSKSIQFSDPSGTTDRASDVVISPVKAVIRYGEPQQFTAMVPRKPGSAVKWHVLAGGGKIDDNGLYKADDKPVGAAAGAQAYATVQVTSVEFPEASDLAVITLT